MSSCFAATSSLVLKTDVDKDRTLAELVNKVGFDLFM